MAASLAFPLTGADDCPPLLNGWVPSPGCQTYYLCEAGKKASPDYNCRDGFLFDVSTTNCQQAGSVKCKALAGDDTGDEPSNAEEPTSKNNQSQAPPSPGACGGLPAVYFVDIPNQTCYSNCQMTKPEWISAIFPTREECCEQNFAWMPVDDCASKEFVADGTPKIWTLSPTIQEGTPAPVEGAGKPISSPTLPPVEMSPDDPKFLFMCGVDWTDASTRCYQRCPNGRDEDCPAGESCFGETSCVNGLIKDTPAPTDPPVTARPTPRTKQPMSPAIPKPTKNPTVGYITHKPTSESTAEVSTESSTNQSMSAMSAVHSINVVESFEDEDNSTSIPEDDYQDDDNTTSIPTFTSSPSSPTAKPTRRPPATRRPRPDTTPPEPTPVPIEPTTPLPSSGGFPTFAPTIVPSQKPNYVVSMIAIPETAGNIDTMSESTQDSPFNKVYGFGMVPSLNEDSQSSQDSQGSQYLSLYSQDYAQTVQPVTEAPLLPFSEAFFGSSSMSTSELIIPVSADATVSPKRPDLNFGLNSMLALDGGNTFEQFDILLKFDVSIVDEASKIKSATLNIYAAEDCPFGGAYYSATSFNSDWTASDITWNTAPKSLALLDSLGSVSAHQWYHVDVTSMFNLRLSTYVTIRVESSTMGRCMFASMEHESSNAPYIVLNVESSESQIVGMSGSIGNDAPAPVQMEFLPIESGEYAIVRASSDATIDAIRVNEKLGLLPSLHISLSIEPRQIFESLIHFDITEFQQYKPKAAMLVLFPEMKCHSAGKIAVTGTNIEDSEKEITWANAPGSELVIGTFGAVEAGYWYGFNVLKALEWARGKKMGAITFRISSDGDYSCQYSSIQSGRAPKLLASF